MSKPTPSTEYIAWFETLGKSDVGRVGGKNASLGEMVQRLAPGMITANAASTNAVGAFVSRLQEGGSTSLEQAILAGLDSEAHDLLVLTDGLPTDSTPEAIIGKVRERNQSQQHRISTVGVGDDQVGRRRVVALGNRFHRHGRTSQRFTGRK